MKNGAGGEKAKLFLVPLKIFDFERDRRIELLTSDWKSDVLPVN